MKLKTLVSTMVAIGAISSSAIFAAPVAASAPTQVIGLGPIWNNIIERNQDNAAGVVGLQAGQTQITGGVATNAGYVNRQYAPAEAAYHGEAKASYGLSLSDAELYVDSQVNAWVRAHVAFAYGADFTAPRTNQSGTRIDYVQDMFFPEAYVTLYNGGNFYAKAGREYLNFGSQSHDSISTPLPITLSTMDETAITLGGVNLGNTGLYADATLYNGKPYREEVNSIYQAHGYVAELGFTQQMVTQGYNAYVDYVGNILDAMNFDDLAGTLFSPVSVSSKAVPGLAVHADFHTGPFTVMADYVSALTTIGGSDWTPSNQWYFNGSPAKPSAYSLEGDYGFVVAGKTATATIGYDASQEAAGFIPLGGSVPMPASRVLVAYTVALSSNVNLGLEYDYDTDYSDSTTAGPSVAGSYTGTGNSDSIVTARLKVLF